MEVMAMLEIEPVRRLAFAAALCGAVACSSYTDPPLDDYQAEFITVRRAWRPGERDSVIQQVLATQAWILPFAGNLSPMVGQILRADSIDEIVANPAFVPLSSSPFGGGGLFHVSMVPGTGWSAFGLDIRILDNSQSPADSSNWLGLFWYNDAEPTWIGFILLATPLDVVSGVTPNTPSFDASEGTTGSGAGEFRQADATYWEARGTGAPNKVDVLTNTAAGPLTTVTSGGFTGGTQQSRDMRVRMRTVGFTRITGPTNPTSMTVSFDYTGNGTALTCIFPDPCTGP
jgi:hypothetical protein